MSTVGKEPTVVPTSSWHSKPDYNQLLPYSISDREDPTSEPSALLAEIETGLASCVLSGDITLGANSWTKRLHAYLNLKYPLPLESRLKLADLYFQLLVAPRVYDSSMTQYWAVYLLKLVKKQHPDLPDNAWSIPWRPLHSTIESIIQQKQREKAHENDRRNVTTVMRTVEFTKRFFQPGSTQEILEEFLPSLYPFSHKVIPGALPSILSSPSATLSILSETLSTFTPTMLLRAQAYLVLFLPTNVSDVSLWFDTFLSVWGWQRNSSLWDTLWLDLYSRVARDRIGHITWEPRVVRHMFTVTLKTLEVPVGRGTGIAGRLKIGSKDKLLSFMKDKDVRASCARLIVYMMSPHEDNHVLFELKKLIQAVETFFHPSNHTHRLSSVLAGFLRNLTTYFLKRLSEESEPDCKTPEEFRITEEMKNEFVTTLKHVAFLSMFGKDDMVVNNSITALRCLGYVKPELIVPPLMEKVSYSLESLTETHRTNSSIIALSSLARIILTRKMYPMGATHILDLFNMVLPGIDANDSIKTITTFKFISSCLFCLPLMEADNPNSTLTVPSWSDELIEETVFSVTKGFEEFAINFIERIFALLENMPEREAGMTHMMLYCADLFFQSLSPEIFELVLAKTIAFISNNVIASAIKTIGIFCCTLTTSNRKSALAKFIPLCCSSILEEIENGAGSDVNATSQSDLKLTWFQSIFAGVLRYSGSEVMKYQKQVLETIATMTQLKSKRGYKYAGKALRNLIRSLTWTYTLDERNFSVSTMNDPNFRKTHFQQWGTIEDSHGLSLEWHVPSDEEINFALHMVEIFLKPMMLDLTQIADGSNASAVDKNDFIRKLTLCRYVVKGISTLTIDVPSNTCEADQEIHEDDNCTKGAHPKRRFINAGYCLTDSNDARCQDIRKTRLELGVLLHKLVHYLKNEREDDTKSIKIVLKIINVFLTNRGETKEKYESRRAVVKLLKMASQDYSTHTKRSQRYPRYVLARRLHMLHTERLFLNATIAPKLGIHQELMEDLLDMSMSHYTAIRKLAQSILDTAISCFQSSKYSLLERIFKQIESNKLSPDGLKGALYLLRMRPFQSAYLRDWNTMASFMKVIFNGRHENKESIQKLIEVVYLEFTYRYVSPTLTFNITEEIVEAAGKILNRQDLEILSKNASEQISERNSTNVQIYKDLINDLLAIVHANNLHWRFARMAILFLGLLLTRKDQPVNWEVVQYLAKTAVSELIVLRSVALKALNNNIYVHKQQALSAQTLAYKTQISPSLTLEDYLRQLNTPIQSEEEYTSAHFQDQEYLGWYQFTKQYKVYTPNNGQIAAILREPLESHAPLFLSEEFWDKCMVYMSQEQGDSDITVSVHNLLFFKGLFEIYDTQLLSILKNFIESNVNNYTYKNVQKTVAEIIAGMLRGSKHWEYTKWKSMLDFIAPLLTEKIFPNLTLEVIPLWTAALQWAMTNRDPRRFSTIIERLMEYPLNLETS
ncbi:Proteasome activator BLM10, partial [Basidiobolus ranarum]